MGNCVNSRSLVGWSFRGPVNADTDQNHYFSEQGYSRFFHANNGVEALKTIEGATNPPIGLIFCDWNMPNMSGLELLKKVRQHDQYKTIPFIMVTSERLAEKVKMAIQEGVSNYIVKPFDARAVKQKLERTFRALQAKEAA